MSSTNRTAKYDQLYKSLKKHFKPGPEVGERTVLEHLIYACCLEDSRAEQADEAFAKLQQTYFDWNEVRVTTAIELSEALNSLPQAMNAGHRIKRCLQSLFETRYQYDIDDMKKANLGKAIADLEAWKGVTPFVLNYVSQHALGGHSIPIDSATLEVLQQCEVITASEADKKSVPGIERAIPKNKGSEFASLLHQFAIEFQLSPKSAAVLAVFKDMGVTPKPKAKLPEKKEAAPAPKSKPESPAVSAKPDAGSAKKSTASVEPVAGKPGKQADAKSAESRATDSSEVAKAAKKADPKAAAATKPGVAPPAKKTDKPEKADAKKSDAKTPDSKKSDAKPEVKKVEAKAVDKAADKKPVAKKPVEKPAPGKPKPTEKPVAKKPDTASKSAASKSSASAKITKKKPR